MRVWWLIGTFTVTVACGCGHRALSVPLETMPRLAPSAFGLDLPGLSLAGAGKHATHQERDIGEIAIDDEGRPVSRRGRPQRWRYCAGFVVDLYTTGGHGAGPAIELRRGLNAFSVMGNLTVGYILYDDGFDAAHSWHNVAFEGFRMQYRRHHQSEDWYWQAGVTMVKLEGDVQLFASSEHKEAWTSQLFIHFGVGWRSYWGGGRRVFSEMAASILAGPSIELPEEYLGNELIAYGPLDARLSITLLGASF